MGERFQNSLIRFDIFENSVNLSPYSLVLYMENFERVRVNFTAVQIMNNSNDKLARTQPITIK